MRLIDADKLFNEVAKESENNPHTDFWARRRYVAEHERFMKMIMKQPTVYDMDYVLARMDKAEEEIKEMVENEVRDLEYCEALKTLASDIINFMRTIVRSGGVNER